MLKWLFIRSGVLQILFSGIDFLWNHEKQIAKADRLKFYPYMSINENRNLFKDLGH